MTRYLISLIITVQIGVSVVSKELRKYLNQSTLGQMVHLSPLKFAICIQLDIILRLCRCLSMFIVND